MTRVALDSNVLLYAELEPESDKGKLAAEPILQVARDGVIAVRVIGEFLRVTQRCAPSAFEGAVRQTSTYRAAFLTPAHNRRRHNACGRIRADPPPATVGGVVCAASAVAGAKVSTDRRFQDGRALEGMRLINPFTITNDRVVKQLLGA